MAYAIIGNVKFQLLTDETTVAEHEYIGRVRYLISQELDAIEVVRVDIDSHTSIVWKTVKR